jgi:hypothetical protein
VYKVINIHPDMPEDEREEKRKEAERAAWQVLARCAQRRAQSAQ